MKKIQVTCCIIMFVAMIIATVMEVEATREPPNGPESVKFYLHNTVYDATVNNSDAYNSVYSALPPALDVALNPFSFGGRATFEDPLTDGPDLDSSNVIGVAQGVFIFDSQKEYILFHIFTAIFNTSTLNGTIVIMGQIVEALPTRTLAVVGGTGDFLAARGSAFSTLVSINHTAPARWTLSFDLDLYY